MSPINHLLTGWVVANANTALTPRDRAAITLACIVPDLDGLGIVAEYLTEGSAHPLTWWSQYHHVLAHNLLFGVILALAVYVICNRSVAVAILSFLTFHLHLAEDLISGRPGGGDAWAIRYMYPFSDSDWAWSGQWELDAWPNFIVVGVLLLATFYLAWKRGYSPVGMISRRADERFVAALRQRFGRP